MTPVKLAAVIMASGLSRRMPVNKLLMDVHGKPLAEWVMDSVKISGFYQVTVVTRCTEIAQIARSKGFGVKNNEHPLLGQSQSVILGTRCHMDADGIMFLPADMPFLSAGVLDHLKHEFFCAPERIIRPLYVSHPGGPCPGSPVIFPESLFSELCELSGDRGGKDIILRHGELVTQVPVYDVYAGIDIDTLKDAQQWLNYLK